MPSNCVKSNCDTVDTGNGHLNELQTGIDPEIQTWRCSMRDSKVTVTSNNAISVRGPDNN